MKKSLFLSIILGALMMFSMPASYASPPGEKVQVVDLQEVVEKDQSAMFVEKEQAPPILYAAISQEDDTGPKGINWPEVISYIIGLIGMLVGARYYATASKVASKAETSAELLAYLAEATKDGQLTASEIQTIIKLGEKLFPKKE